MSSILSFLIAFAIQAVALKLSLSMLGYKGASNTLGNALGIVLFMNVAVLVVSFVPIFSLLLKPLVIVLVIMAFYKTSLLKSVGAALLQVGLQIAIKWLLALIGLSLASQHLLWFGT